MKRDILDGQDCRDCLEQRAMWEIQDQQDRRGLQELMAFGEKVVSGVYQANWVKMALQD